MDLKLKEESAAAASSNAVVNTNPMREALDNPFVSHLFLYIERI
jgi:hypothetical protein